jgi:hypothetical protein
MADKISTEHTYLSAMIDGNPLHIVVGDFNDSIRIVTLKFLSRLIGFWQKIHHGRFWISV